MGQTITEKIKRYWRKKKGSKSMPKKTVWEKIKEVLNK